MNQQLLPSLPWWWRKQRTGSYWGTKPKEWAFLGRIVTPCVFLRSKRIHTWITVLMHTHFSSCVFIYCHFIVCSETKHTEWTTIAQGMAWNRIKGPSIPAPIPAFSPEPEDSKSWSREERSLQLCSQFPEFSVTQSPARITFGPRSKLLVLTLPHVLHRSHPTPLTCLVASVYNQMEGLQVYILYILLYVKVHDKLIYPCYSAFFIFPNISSYYLSIFPSLSLPLNTLHVHKSMCTNAQAWTRLSRNHYLHSLQSLIFYTRNAKQLEAWQE